MKNWQRGDAAFLETARGYIFCTVVDASDPDVVSVTFDGNVEPSRVARDRLKE